jgi:putative transcriptional regulator
MEPITPGEEPIDPQAQEYLDTLGNGAVLLARDVLQDPNFKSAVVLICIYSKDGGAYGLIINRRAHMPLSEIFDGFVEASEPREVFIGGPVQQEEIQVVQITDEPVPDSHRVAPRVYLGGKWENLDQMFSFDDRSTHLFLGYSGWAAGQLESEIHAGAWQVFRINLEKLLMNIDRVATADMESVEEFLETIRN